MTDDRKFRILLFANTDWYLYNFRRTLAIALRDDGHDVVLVSPDGPYGERLTELGLRWIVAPMARESLNPFREARLLFWLWRLILRERPDIVHGFTIKCAVYAGLAGRAANVARVSAIAGMGAVYISRSLKARALQTLLRPLMRAALGGGRSTLVLQNSDDARFFESAGFASPGSVRLIRGSGVDFSRFSVPVAEPGAYKPRQRVVLAARTLWDKGIDEFVRAASILKSEGRDLEFILAGAPDPGNPASIPAEALRSWTLSGLIEWVGHVEDMPALYAASDIVVLPSYREGLPKSLIEAAACARPLVTTDVPGCREVVTNEIDGLLVPARDAEALAQAIARLCDDPELAVRLGRAARRKALDQFDEKIVISQTKAVYREVCGVE